ncbi:MULTISPECIES: aminopeptidase N [unclassified Luteococcus]|uniref:aminopeptidase N n=1 Tax=unclassified Luteococcus TaxID=2639923 RepID=UPI00313A9457
MTTANITRESAQQRSRIVTAEAYLVTVDLSGLGLDGEPLAEPTETFLSTSEITFTSQGGESHVDLIADEVLDAWLDETQVDVTRFADGTLPFSSEPGEHRLVVTALCRYSHTGEGLHRFVDPADGKVYLYTQFETADARRMYATFEQPDQKATFQLNVIAPRHWQVVSNAQAVEPVEGANGNGIWEFEPTLKVATYITALIAGEYHRVEHTLKTKLGEIPASVMCRQSMAEFLDDERIMHTTQRGFDVFEASFGHPYPFGSYDQIFVPEFNAGAMENAGCVTFRDEYLFRSRVGQEMYESRDNTILHELAHMWFGDLVTMTWWDDLWLNESFAEWASHFCLAKIHEADGGTDPWVGFCNGRKSWAYRQDQLPTTHPIAADMVDLEAVEQNFDGITYAKGASVLKQLVAFVGEDAFLAGVQAYFAEHAFGNTQLSDLLGALEKSSGRDLSNFSAQWLETTGPNVLRADFDLDDQGRFTRFDVVQTANPEHPTLRTHRMGIGVFTLTDGVLRRSHELEVDIDGERTPIPALVGVHRGDLVLLNDRDLTYAKVRLDEQSLATLVQHVHQMEDPLARAVCWAAAWDMCRDAEMPAADYISLVLQGIAQETDPAALAFLRNQAVLAGTSYTPDDQRAAGRARLTAGFAGLLKQSEPGSDHQLGFANGIISAVDSAAGAELLKAWLAGDEVPDGLQIDADMRWRITRALARMGAVGTAEIDAEAQRDKTISGAEWAAACRASLPTTEAKAEAWRLACEDPEVPNGTQEQVCRAFWSDTQGELLQPYADKYLELCRAISGAEGIWKTRGHAASQNALVLLFPTVPVAGEAFLGRVEELLATDLSAGVRRVLLEQSDAARRALRCQAASA